MITIKLHDPDIDGMYIAECEMSHICKDRPNNIFRSRGTNQHDTLVELVHTLAEHGEIQ